MEPPAKRLRILQSVEVDDTDPGYIKAKQKQQQKFKGRLESIFAKYEHMHESMSDEIDMRENKVVVDRGHLRRVVRQVKRRETVLLDTLGLAVGQVPEELEESEGEMDDSEDELAPTQRPRSSSDATMKEPKQQQRQMDAAKPASSASISSQSPKAAHNLEPRVDALAQPYLPQIPPSPNPAANLMQFMQFPQTPAGKQAQTSFCAALAQTINQAVQQAVVPLFSSMLQNTPNVAMPFTSAFSTITTPVTSRDAIAPATDPKWFFPSLDTELKVSKVQQSSPLPQPTLQDAAQTSTEDQDTSSTNGGMDEDGMDIMQPLRVLSPVISSATMLADESFKKRARQTSPRIELQSRRKRGPVAKYKFTMADDIYISRCKLLHKRTMAEIRNSQEKWATWPVTAFQNRWQFHLKGKDLHLLDMQEEGSDDTEITSEPNTHHLPTPSSSGHEDGTVEPNQHDLQSAEMNPSSSVHFDDEERDLLSLAGSEDEGEPLPNNVSDDEVFFPEADELILPSVEITDFINEDTLQQGLLDDLPSDGIPLLDAMEDIMQIKIESDISSPIRRRKLAPLAFEAVPDTDMEDEIDGTLRTTTSDELQTTTVPPTTPRIKREFSTPPPPTTLLYSTPTATFSHSRTDVLSSGVKSASSTLSRKAYLKQVKQSWTKKATPVLAKRKSFNVLPRKRAWAEEGDSDDELA